MNSVLRIVFAMHEVGPCDRFYARVVKYIVASYSKLRCCNLEEASDTCRAVGLKLKAFLAF